MNTNLDEPIFKLGDVASAINVSASTIKTWRHRGYFLLRESDGDEPADGTGNHARFTMRTALRLALMGCQVRWGVHPQIAFQNALKFTDVGAGDAGWSGGKRFRELKLKSARSPGECFESGSTWFLLQSPTGHAEVVNIEAEDPAQKTIEAYRGSGVYEVLFINLNSLCLHVRGHLEHLAARESIE